MRKCEVDGCTGQHRARGFCILHYNNWVRYQSGVGKFEAKFRAAERERIVKLLTRMHDGLTDDSGHTVESVTIAKAIDLIEGKNK
jgi:hypothetical protein